MSRPTGRNPLTMVGRLSTTLLLLSSALLVLLMPALVLIGAALLHGMSLAETIAVLCSCLLAWRLGRCT
ncbi:MAG: hypothetical protein AAGG11_12905 [Pseudomonadota bacterium]